MALKSSKQGSSSKQCWVLDDGRVGHFKQSLALARALGVAWQAVPFSLLAPWVWIAPRITTGMRLACRFSALPETAPDLIIGCGRRAAAVSRMLKRRFPQAKTIQILHPRINTSHWDAVIAPIHDTLMSPNVLATIGALNFQSNEPLAIPEALQHLPKPLTAVLIGASHTVQEINRVYIDDLLVHLRKQYERDGGSVIFVGSRRTPHELIDYVRAQRGDLPGVVFEFATDINNPYPALLQNADKFVVTPDSVSMISEACATGKPVFCFARTPLKGKLRRMHERLLHDRFLYDISWLPTSPKGKTLRETQHIADQLRLRLKL